MQENDVGQVDGKTPFFFFNKDVQRLGGAISNVKVHICVQGDWVYETATDLRRMTLGLKKN